MNDTLIFNKIICKCCKKKFSFSIRSSHLRVLNDNFGEDYINSKTTLCKQCWIKKYRTKFIIKNVGDVCRILKIKFDIKRDLIEGKEYYEKKERYFFLDGTDINTFYLKKNHISTNYRQGA